MLLSVMLAMYLHKVVFAKGIGTQGVPRLEQNVTLLC